MTLKISLSICEIWNPERSSKTLISLMVTWNKKIMNPQFLQQTDITDMKPPVKESVDSMFTMM